jgi:hypothetical protein
MIQLLLMLWMDPKKADKRKELMNKLKVIGIVLIIILVLIKLNRTLFFLALFSVLAFAGKIIRGQFGLSMVVLDPLLFSTILISQFMGIKELVVFLFLNVFVADIVSGIFSPGSFLNYVLYHAAPLSGVLIFGGMSMMVYGNIASLVYSVSYAFFRSTLLPDDPVKVVAKSITSFIFTFLYITFFGPLFQVVMLT